MPSVMYLFLLFLVSPIGSFPTQSPEPCPSGRGECRRMKECPAEVAMFNENPSILPSLLCSMDPSGYPMICCNKTPPLPEVTRENTAMRISKAKCHEYQLMLAETKSSDCEYLQQPLITGGTAAEPFEFPHMVWEIVFLRTHEHGPKLYLAVAAKPVGCSKSTAHHWADTFGKTDGTNWEREENRIPKGKEEEPMVQEYIASSQILILKNRALSSGFSKTLVVRLGEHDLEDEADTIPDDYAVDEIAYHDIALLRLDNDVPIRSIIYPACLPTDKDIPPPGTPLVVAGWGRLFFDKNRATVLQKVTVPLNDTLECDRMNKFIIVRKNYPNGMKGQVLCAGIEGKDSCQGDSGGPLMLPRNASSCVNYVLGTVSTGAGCGAQGFPGFYTNVPFYLDWIEETVWKNDP
ncbi:unnamed protein product [Darwinula stevensoni]|uniref:Peptidase S1 domain-containing protein n=1 Tax=Darwinula stevensoni TaxID=69355 RepID=A0A7R8XJT7_9CRUS|nr:unnamed protein product [Darwinula stevensoni]CAG0895117.1 unnamed protein product [Darwinula stevensoni]